MHKELLGKYKRWLRYLRRKMFNFIIKQFWIFLLLAVIFGLSIEFFSLVTPYIMYLLMIILFLTSLKIDIRDIIKNLKKPFLIIYLIFLVLVATPLISYFLVKGILAPEYSLAILILVAMPAGMATPAYADILKANTPLSLILATISSLIAPITITLILLFTTGTRYSLQILNMFYSLSFILIFPFALSQIIKPFTKRLIKKTQKYYSPLSIILLVFVIAGAIAKIRDAFFQVLPEILFPSIILSLVTILLTITGYYSIPKQNKQTRRSSALATTYMNSSLALVFAAMFFTQKTLLLVTMQQFIGNIWIIGFSYIIKRKSNSDISVGNNWPAGCTIND